MTVETYAAWVLPDGSVHRVDLVPEAPEGAEMVTYHRMNDGTDIRADDWSALRKHAILAKWPLHLQAEASADAASGDPTKMNALLSDLAEIKDLYPKGQS